MVPVIILLAPLLGAVICGFLWRQIGEKTGQYVEGTTFVEALIPFRGQWFLYYGTADTRVGVAVTAAPARP